MVRTRKKNGGRQEEWQGKRVAHQERWPSDWQDVNFEGTIAKGPSVPRNKYEDAAAAAELFVDKGGREPVKFSRKGGSCIAGESWERKLRI